MAADGTQPLEELTSLAGMMTMTVNHVMTHFRHARFTMSQATVVQENTGMALHGIKTRLHVLVLFDVFSVAVSRHNQAAEARHYNEIQTY